MDFNYTQLNEEQKKAIGIDAPVVLVRSAVGSGKTSVLVYKILSLCEQGISPHDLVVLTFTRKAADEIRQRLTEKVSWAKELEYCGTFHSVANRLLRDYFDLTSLGISADFSIMEEREQQEVLEELCFDHSIRMNKRMLAKFKHPEVQDNKNIISLANHYKLYKERCNMVDFDDLILYVELLLSLQKTHFKWVIVDEFQDTDIVQAKVLKKMVSQGAKLFAVGDPNQTIYSWRGSNPHIFDDFCKLPMAVETPLSINYRSAANIVIAIKGLIDTPLRARREPGEHVFIKEHLNPSQEAMYIAHKINHFHLQGIPLEEIAVLYRRQDQRKVLGNILRQNEIPFIIQRQPKLEEIPILNWVLNLLCVCLNKKNLFGMRYVLGHKKFGLKGDKKKILKERIQNFRAFIKERQSKVELSKFLLLDEVCSPTSISFANNQKYIDAFWEELIPDDSVVDFSGTLEKNILCRDYNLSIIIEKVEGSQCEGVQLMTLHSSKGLEFSHVFIIGANEGNIPIKKTDDEEEKRLFFVGLSRAKNFVEVSYTRESEVFGVAPEASRYLECLTESAVNWEKLQTEKKNIQELAKKIKQEQQPQEARVARHDKYGIGKVVQENNDAIVVDFPGYGEKSFAKAFCPLHFDS